jgi:coenzyme PQQ biosynthesis protein PqqD
LNASAGVILQRCRGQETVSSIVNTLSAQYPDTERQRIEDDVHRLIGELSRRGLLTLE